ncbi:hypothetical protein GMOD_00006356 [Pyrenophora seminiperda CCB06]|uniref:Transcriptional coactivator p15 (PC4) C-terminal domain-containing protein n=1 Tax=Pyrenophora seminiperda CCB06 TaxID=1302712 RepID=A0A3M7M552_9PLEO|nr:hypothetical protein GMOD_00006356 [Pyrenophora seminiperda CCB06]
MGSIRVLALLVALAIVGLGAWSIIIVRDIEDRSAAVLKTVHPESEMMGHMWEKFFIITIHSIVKLWISMATAAFASLGGIIAVLAAMFDRKQVPSAVLIPLEFLCMCAMGTALGVSLSFTMDLDEFTKSRLEAGGQPDLLKWAVLVHLSRGYAIGAGAGWFLFLVTSITAVIAACCRLQERESCSFEPTASALGMGHGHDAVLPPQSRSRVPTMYDPQVPKGLKEKLGKLPERQNTQRRDSVGRTVEMARSDTVVSQDGRISFEDDNEMPVPLTLEQPERAQQWRPSRPWSELSEVPSLDVKREIAHAPNLVGSSFPYRVGGPISVRQSPCVIAAISTFPQYRHLTSATLLETIFLIMVRTKGGRARGGGFNKGFAQKRSFAEEDDSAPHASKKAKGDENDDSTPVIPELKTDDNGDVYVGLNTSCKRRLTISDYNKNTLVSIREYYTTDSGETKPGKKGISLTIDQYNTLLAAAPLIEATLKKKDIQVVRPDYSAEPGGKSDDTGRKKEPEEDKDAAKADDDDDDDEE